MKNTWKKILTGTAVTIAAVGSFGVAFGWWSTTGSGSDTAATTDGVVDVLTFDTSTINDMYPGDSSQNFSVTVTNTDAAESVYVDTVNVYVTTDQAGCDGSDFLIDGAEAPSTLATAVELTWVDQELAAGEFDDATGSIQFNNKAENQDDCKDAVVTLNYDVPAAV
jgi:hypothetical protein